MAYMTAQHARLRPDQRAALQGLRSAAGPAGFELQDAERNMVDENEREARNTLTMLSTPADRRQHLQLAPGGDVYMPSESTMNRIGNAAVFGGTPGDTFEGHASPMGIGSLSDKGWAGFRGHFADKDRMAAALPNLLRGLKSARR
jgi:hypothetical protein